MSPGSASREIGKDVCIIPSLSQLYKAWKSKFALEKIGLTGYNVAGLPNFLLGTLPIHLGLLEVVHDFLQIFSQLGLLSLQLVQHGLACIELLLEQAGGLPGSLARRLLLRKLCGGPLGLFPSSLGLMLAGFELCLQLGYPLLGYYKKVL